MKIEDARNTYQELSAKTSDLARTLSFSVIAIVWVFKQETESGISVPSDLMVPSLFAVMALASDLLQYISSTVCWGIFGRIREIKSVDDKEQFKAPAYINWPAILFFYLKLLFVALAYIYLASYILGIFKESGAL